MLYQTATLNVYFAVTVVNTNSFIVGHAFFSLQIEHKSYAQAAGSISILISKNAKASRVLRA